MIYIYIYIYTSGSPRGLERARAGAQQARDRGAAAAKIFNMGMLL